jgi:hypothetical protein
MPDNEVDFDAELNAAMGLDPNEGNAGLQSKQTQPTESPKLKFGGRDWDSPEKLGKAYEALHKDYTRKSQEFSRLKPYGEFDSYLNKHPELRKVLSEKIAEYNSRISAGQSQATAQKAAGLPPEVMDRVERMEAFFEDQKLEREVDQLKNKFGLDRDDIKIVLHKASELAEKGAVLPLADVFKILSYEERTMEAKKAGEKEAVDRITGRKKADVGSSNAPAVSPSAKSVHEMNESEHTKAIMDKLNGLGYSG